MAVHEGNVARNVKSVTSAAEHVMAARRTDLQSPVKEDKIKAQACK